MRCILFCAGDLGSCKIEIEKDDMVIAVDGGYAACEKVNITPNLILGDFDSIQDMDKAILAQREDVIVLPIEKDDTDTLAAIRHGIAAGYREFYIYGALGGERMEHTIANLQCLLFMRSRQARGYLIGQNSICLAIDGESAFLPYLKDTHVSVFSIAGSAEEVSIGGLKYQLTNSCLEADYPLGVSNSFENGKAGEIVVGKGKLLIILTRDAAAMKRGWQETGYGSWEAYISQIIYS